MNNKHFVDMGGVLRDHVQGHSEIYIMRNEHGYALWSVAGACIIGIFGDTWESIAPKLREMIINVGECTEQNYLKALFDRVVGDY